PGTSAMLVLPAYSTPLRIEMSSGASTMSGTSVVVVDDSGGGTVVSVAGTVVELGVITCTVCLPSSVSATAATATTAALASAPAPTRSAVRRVRRRRNPDGSGVSTGMP